MAEHTPAGAVNSRRVLMCGSELNVKGGMVTVIRGMLSSAGWTPFEIEYIPTHNERGRLAAALLFVGAYLKILSRAARGKYCCAYLHVSERGSFFRKALILRLLRRRGIRVALHHHGAEFYEFYERLSPRGQSFVHKTILGANLNIVLGEAALSRMLAAFNGVNAAVVRNCVTTPPKNPYDIRAKNVLFLGRLGQRKGVYDMLKAIARIDARLPEETRFMLCGDGDIDEVKGEIARLGIEGRIEHVGWVSGELKDDALSRAAVHALPSYHEQLPMSILECMARGIPTLSTRVAAIPEVVSDGVNGFLIEPGDIDALAERLLRLLTDDALRERFSDNAWRFAREQLSPDNAIERVKSLLCAL